MLNGTADPINAPIIQIKDMSKTFHTSAGEVNALKNVNFSVQKGDIFGIIGASGAGKSTLVRCINLLERPTEGEVLIDGLNICTMSEKELRNVRHGISMIFQQFNLLMQRTALQNICFPMEITGVPKEEAKKRAKELLELVGLPNKADAYPSQLSGGQKQRVAIARALATDPKVLLCDEATSALDPTTTRSILRLIKDINERLGITVIIITHEMSVIEEICSHVAIIDSGTIAEMGKTQEIFANPKTTAAQRLVYPDGNSIQRLMQSKVCRIVFDGGTSYEPLIATMVLECQAKVNILGADTRNIDGKAFGSMLIGLPEGEDDAQRILKYLKNLKSHGVSWQSIDAEEV